jgi:hypothetical protein
MLKMGLEEKNRGKVPTKGKIGWMGGCPRNPKYSYRRDSGFQQEEEEAHGGARRDQSGQSVQLVAKVGSDRGSTLLEEQQLFLQCHCQTFCLSEKSSNKYDKHKTTTQPDDKLLCKIFPNFANCFKMGSAGKLFLNQFLKSNCTCLMGLSLNFRNNLPKKIQLHA